MKFSLWSDPWIDVVRTDGALERVSIADCIGRAQELYGIAAPSPLSSIGVQRLLIASVLLMPRRPTPDTARPAVNPKDPAEVAV